MGLFLDSITDSIKEVENHTRITEYNINHIQGQIPVICVGSTISQELPRSDLYITGVSHPDIIEATINNTNKILTISFIEDCLCSNFPNDGFKINMEYTSIKTVATAQAPYLFQGTVGVTNPKSMAMIRLEGAFGSSDYIIIEYCNNKGTSSIMHSTIGSLQEDLSTYLGFSVTIDDINKTITIAHSVDGNVFGNTLSGTVSRQGTINYTGILNSEKVYSHGEFSVWTNTLTLSGGSLPTITKDTWDTMIYYILKDEMPIKLNGDVIVKGFLVVRGEVK